MERDLGEQPLVEIMRENALKPHDLTVSSDEQITHKMVNRAMKGRRLNPHVQKKIVNAYMCKQSMLCLLNLWLVESLERWRR